MRTQVHPFHVLPFGGVPIELSGKSDRDLLVEIVTTLNRFAEDLRDTNKNLEPRIRALENFRWWILGASAALSLAGNLLGKVLFR